MQQYLNWYYGHLLKAIPPRRNTKFIGLELTLELPFYSLFSSALSLVNNYRIYLQYFINTFKVKSLKIGLIKSHSL